MKLSIWCLLLFTSIDVMGANLNCASECNRTKADISEEQVAEWKAGYCDEKLGKNKITVFSKGTGAPILLMHELPGLSADTVQLAEELATEYTVYLPLFHGEFGDRIASVFAAMHAARKSKRFKFFDSCDLGEVRQEMKELVHLISNKHGGADVVVVGNCMTGSLPFELIAEPCVRKAVVCQPALPMSLTSKRKMGLSEKAIKNSVQAMKDDSSKRLYFFNYYKDCFAPVQRAGEMVRRIDSEMDIEGRVRVFLAIKWNRKKPQKIFPPSVLTEIPVQRDKAHSTVTGALEDEYQLKDGPCQSDRKIFRAHLHKILKE